MFWTYISTHEKGKAAFVFETHGIKITHFSAFLFMYLVTKHDCSPRALLIILVGRRAAAFDDKNRNLNT